MKLLCCLLLLLALTCCVCSTAKSTNVLNSTLPVSLGPLTVVPSFTKVYRSKSHTLRIHGSDFPTAQSYALILLTFEPPLVQGVDFITVPTNGDGVHVILLYDRVWRTEPGPLILTDAELVFENRSKTNTYVADGGIQVAEVISDPALPHTTVDTDEQSDGELSLDPSDLRVYQSALQQSITITGTGFGSDLSLLLDPHLEVNVDYTLSVTSPTSAVLHLLPGKQWRFESGFLYVRSVKSGDNELFVNHIDGVRIADVYADPAVYFSSLGTADKSGVEHYKVVSQDYNSVVDINFSFHDTVRGAFRIVSVPNPRTMLVNVVFGPPFHYEFGMPLFTMDTGAGSVPVLFAKSAHHDSLGAEMHTEQHKDGFAYLEPGMAESVDDAGAYDGADEAELSAWDAFFSPFLLYRGSATSTRRKLQAHSTWFDVTATVVRVVLPLSVLLVCVVALRMYNCDKQVGRISVMTVAVAEVV